MGAPLTLYFRENCHLCDDMRHALVAFARTRPLQWREIDIDSDAELKRRYDIEVPVLALDDSVICFHFFEEQALRQALAENAP